MCTRSDLDQIDFLEYYQKQKAEKQFYSHNQVFGITVEDSKQISGISVRILYEFGLCIKSEYEVKQWTTS